ncbi:cytidine deaminase [Shewanella sp. 3B26]|uniref:Cytidine deaminase n=1 Tax=Shewanella zhuhaiensis TaxID=2919576 RepID=A0AAJ1BG67_9GAMM|nr:cytidine deaminase [Shewanella zhuhaiensis]MCH4294189.1 cytidine deaminase [Shewanella zhuhaiensis]
MQDRFVRRINELPKELADALMPMLGEHFCGHLDAQQVKHLCDVSGLDSHGLGLALLPIAAALARPPVSDFYVGAIAVGSGGDFYMGANLELQGEALFHSVHAEQSAISHAWLSGETHISDIIVNASPCGHCRQFMNELVDGQAIRIHLPGQDTAPLSHYLPYAFGPTDLNITTPLLTKQQTELELESDDPLLIEALDHAGLSYAPYSLCHAAVVLQTQDGASFCGRYAENAAFNPSMLPMQMALSALVRHNRDFSDIKRAVLLESSQGKISLVGATMDALHAVAAVELEHLVVDPV